MTQTDMIWYLVIAVRRVEMDEDLQKQRKPQVFRLGETVRIVSGPFVSFAGTIEGINQAKSLLKVKVAIYGVGTRDVRAYGCVHCQNLQFAVQFNESDLDRYQQFEGGQPDVLERIKRKPEEVGRR